MNLNVEIIEENKLIEINEDSNIELICNNDTNIFIMINDGCNITINAKFNEGNINVIIFNQSKSNVDIKEVYNVDGANVRLCHGYFSHNDINIDHYTKVYSGDISFETYGLIKSKVNIIELLENVKPNTNINILNNAVVLKDSNFNISASGSILKDAYNSANLQATNCLTFGELDSVKILPILLIDENDVKASHSCAIGTMNELQRFYLQSRGLSESQISELITTGYVLPLTRVIEDEKFTDLVLRKVSELCLI